MFWLNLWPDDVIIDFMNTISRFNHNPMIHKYSKFIDDIFIRF